MLGPALCMRNSPKKRKHNFKKSSFDTGINRIFIFQQKPLFSIMIPALYQELKRRMINDALLHTVRV